MLYYVVGFRTVHPASYMLMLTGFVIGIEKKARVCVFFLVRWYSGTYGHAGVCTGLFSFVIKW